MSNNLLSGSGFLENYTEQCIRLAKTMVIKFEAEAESINEYVSQTHGSDKVGTYPEQWKYYLNLSGQYHPTDTPMRVTSLDTLEDIDFTRENMDLHVATRAAYQYGTRYYYALLNRYPLQESLIRGILLPVDMEVALNAKDMSILGYPRSLVEDQETNLIEELQSHIWRFRDRWFLERFNLSDNYYNVAFYAMLILSLPAKIKNIRIENIRTRHVHSFHMREALASNYKLDEFYSFLTHEQRAWLYKNYPRFGSEIGQQNQFQEIAKILLEKRSVPLDSFTIHQTNTFDEKHEPIVQVKRTQVTSIASSASSPYFALEELPEKELPVLYGNARYLKMSAESDLSNVRMSGTSVLQTKDLESNMVDYGDSFPEPRRDVYIREWAYLAMTGRYNAYVRFQDPKTGDSRVLIAKDALTYMQVAYLSTMGIALDKVPNVYVWRHRLHPKASIEDMFSVTSGKFDRELEDRVKTIYGMEKEIDPIVSISAFNEYAEQQFQNAKAYWMMTGMEDDHRVHGELKQIINRNYGLTFFERDEPSLDDWLHASNLPPYDFTTDQSLELIESIFTAATGYSQSESGPANVQKAMLGTMAKLLSYSVQIIREINDSSIIPLNWSVIRASKPDISSESSGYLGEGITVLGEQVSGESYAGEIKLDVVSGRDFVRVESESTIPVQAIVDVDVEIESTGERYYINNSMSVMDGFFSGNSESYTRTARLTNRELFMNLTQEQLRQLET